MWADQRLAKCGGAGSKPACFATWVVMFVALIGFTITGPAGAAGPSHGLSAFDELKYPADFKHFEYVNPDAPKGGRLALIGTAASVTFDSFNGFILKGNPAQGLEYLFDSLMVRAYDEPDAVYGLVAESAEVADDNLSVTFRLREEAKFADGSPLRAEDVVFSFETLVKQGHPSYRISLRDVVKAEAHDPLTVRYTFQGELTRDLPMAVATLPIFSKAYYSEHPFDQTTLKPPLGSGPYKIGSFKAGTFVTYVRRDDYWAKDLPVNRGQYNFDELRYEYYRDRQAELEGLLNGSFDLREEFTSVSWATAYDVPAVREGKIVRMSPENLQPSGTQGFLFNTRRSKFADPRTRQAIAMAFDFEWANNNLFYNLYKRTTSYFENSDMKASGPPSPAELALLEPYRDQLPPEVFEDAYMPPVSDGSGKDRKLLRQAAALLDEAGWKLEGGVRRNAKGEVLEFEILSYSEAFLRIIAPFADNLKLLGVTATARLVDGSQYQRRIDDYDFDMTTQRLVLRLTPGVEMKNYWGSQAAATNGTPNLAGIANPVVDALIDKALTAKSREQLVAATRALDRVLRANHYWIPHWFKAEHNLAFWNKYSWPEIKPKYDSGIINTWWYDAEKAAKLQRN